MSVYQTDDEQVEAIKKWWKENGKSVIGGIVLGLAAIGGWKGWQGWQATTGESASILYDELRQSVRVGMVDKSVNDGKRLIGEYGDTAYGSFAGLELARLAYERGEKAVARGHLEWVAEQAPDPALREVARLRLGYLLLDMGEIDALDALLAETPMAPFSGEFAALRGDLARSRGDEDAARAAYQQALAGGVEDRELVRMKLTDIGGDAPAS
jgi:predicted negative regulator of RcsB-dependent stress response